MGIINRTLSESQRREPYQFSLNAVANSVTLPVVFVPYPCSLDAVQLSTNGVSGAPTGILYVNRFIPGAGATSFPVGSTFALVAFGTSGVQNASFGVSLPQIGSTLTTLYANDQLVWLSGGGSSAAAVSINGVLILRPILDVVKFFGIL